MNKIVKNILSFSLIQSFNYIYPIMVIPIIIKIIGVDGYGQIALAQNYAQFILVVILFGFDQYAVKLINGNDRNHGQLIFDIFCIRFFIFLVLSVLLFLIAYENMMPVSGVIIVLGICIQGVIPTWYYHGTSNLRVVVVTNLIGKCISVCCIFFAKNDFDVSIALLLQFIPALCYLNVSLFLAYDIHIYYKKWIREPGYGKRIGCLIKQSTGYFFASFSSSLFSSLTLIIIAHFSSNNEFIGVIAIIDRVMKVFGKIFMVFSNSIFPVSCEIYQRGIESLLCFNLKTAKLILLFIIVAGLSLFSLMYNFKSFTYNGIFLYSYLNYFISYFGWFFFGVINNFLGIQTLMVVGKIKQYSSMLTISGLLNVCLMFMFGLLSKIDFIIFSSFISEVFLSVGLFYIIKDLKNESRSLL